MLRLPARQQLAERRLEAGGAGPGEPNTDDLQPGVAGVVVLVLRLLCLVQDSLEVVGQGDQAHRPLLGRAGIIAWDQ